MGRCSMLLSPFLVDPRPGRGRFLPRMDLGNAAMQGNDAGRVLIGADWARRARVGGLDARPAGKRPRRAPPATWSGSPTARPLEEEVGKRGGSTPASNGAVMHSARGFVLPERR